MRTWLGVLVLVPALALGGCSGGGRQGGAATGSISGAVTVESITGGPGNPAGWRVNLVNSDGLGATVAANGTYAVGSVPPGKYDVQLVPPAKDGVAYACAQPGCTIRNVSVLAGVETVQVSFAVTEVPAPPFE